MVVRFITMLPDRIHKIEAVFGDELMSLSKIVFCLSTQDKVRPISEYSLDDREFTSRMDRICPALGIRIDSLSFNEYYNHYILESLGGMLSPDGTAFYGVDLFELIKDPRNLVECTVRDILTLSISVIDNKKIINKLLKEDIKKIQKIHNDLFSVDVVDSTSISGGTFISPKKYSEAIDVFLSEFRSMAYIISDKLHKFIEEVMDLPLDREDCVQCPECNNPIVYDWAEHNGYCPFCGLIEDFTLFRVEPCEEIRRRIEITRRRTEMERRALFGGRRIE